MYNSLVRSSETVLALGVRYSQTICYSRRPLIEVETSKVKNFLVVFDEFCTSIICYSVLHVIKQFFVL